MIQQLDLLQELIISKLIYKFRLFATSSWDGTIGFINVNGEKVK